MTLIVVLLWGLGAVLVISAIETDPKTGKSVSVLQTISDVWNNRLDFSQPAAAGGGGSGGGFLAQQQQQQSASSYQNAAIASYLKSRGG